MEEVIKYIKKHRSCSIEGIMRSFKLKEYEVLGIVELLKREGMMIDVIDNRIVRVKPEKAGIYKIPNKLDHLKLLLISDTHLGSKFDRIDILKYLYKKAEKEKVDYILHSGDLTEGKSSRPQQQYELRSECLSYAGQRDYVVKNYPKSDIPTFIISGNHDLWWIQRCGSDIVKDICDRREDLTYLGSDCEDLKIGKLLIHMYHGKGGNAYARSYRVQKYLDSIPLEERPHILQTGHTHQAFYMKQDDTHVFQTSCLQDLTSFERSMGFNNDKSCWWVDVYMDDKGKPVQIKQELETFSKKLTKRL